MSRKQVDDGEREGAQAKLGVRQRGGNLPLVFPVTSDRGPIVFKYCIYLVNAKCKIIYNT